MKIKGVTVNMGKDKKPKENKVKGIKGLKGFVGFKGIYKIIFVYTLLAGFLLIFMTGIFYYFTINQTHMDQISAKIISNFNVEQLYLKKGTDIDWTMKEGRLAVGEEVFEGNTGVIDNFKKLTDNEIVVFVNGKSVNTTLMNKFEVRLGDTPLSQDIRSKIEEKGVSTRGKLSLNSGSYQGVYFPIQNKSGQILGVWFQGVPSSVTGQLSSGESSFILKVTVIGLIISLITFYFISNSIVNHIDSFIAYAKTRLLNANSIEASEVIVPLGYEAFNDLASAINKVIRENFSRLSQTSKALKAMIDKIKSLEVQADDVVQRIPKQVDLLKELNKLVYDYTREVDGLFEEEIQTENLSKKHVVKGTIEIIKVSQIAVQDTQKFETIKDIMRTILDQINMLYVNAAIEATKAGEAGRGFTVVADEMRRFSEKSEDLSKEVTEIIERINSDINEINKVVENNTRMGNELFTAAYKLGEQNVKVTCECIEESIELSVNNNKNVKEIKQIAEEINRETKEVHSTILKF